MSPRRTPDTLYTTAFLDVGDEPWIVSLPDLNDRYALFPMLDGWTTVFDVPRKAHHRNRSADLRHHRPRLGRTLPEGVKQYKSQTSIVWLLGRIYCTGTPEDYAAVHKLQDEVKLYPLSAWGKEWTPPAGKVDLSIDMKTAVRDQVNKMDAVEYFTLLADLLKRNPPYEADAPMLEKLAADRHRPRTGLRQVEVRSGFRQARSADRLRQDHAALQVQRRRHQEHRRLGLHDQDRYLRHELCPAGADHGHRAWRQPAAGRDLSDVAEVGRAGSIKRKYDGSEKYVLTFKKGLTPPVCRLLVADHV